MYSTIHQPLNISPDSLCQDLKSIEEGLFKYNIRINNGEYQTLINVNKNLDKKHHPTVDDIYHAIAMFHHDMKEPLFGEMTIATLSSISNGAAQQIVNDMEKINDWAAEDHRRRYPGSYQNEYSPIRGHSEDSTIDSDPTPIVEYPVSRHLGEGNNRVHKVTKDWATGEIIIHGQNMDDANRELIIQPTMFG